MATTKALSRGVKDGKRAIILDTLERTYFLIPETEGKWLSFCILTISSRLLLISITSWRYYSYIKVDKWRTFASQCFSCFAVSENSWMEALQVSSFFAVFYFLFSLDEENFIFSGILILKQSQMTFFILFVMWKEPSWKIPDRFVVDSRQDQQNVVFESFSRWQYQKVFFFEFNMFWECSLFYLSFHDFFLYPFFLAFLKFSCVVQSYPFGILPR